ERRRATELLGFIGKRQLVFVDVAERDDTRQHHRVGLELIEEDLSPPTKRAAGRQIKRCPRQIGRLPARLKPLDQPAVDQRGDDAAQERHGQGNAEDAPGLPDSGSGCIMAWAKAGSRGKSGVMSQATLSRNASSAA